MAVTQLKLEMTSASESALHAHKEDQAQLQKIQLEHMKLKEEKDKLVDMVKKVRS